MDFVLESILIKMDKVIRRKKVDLRVTSPLGRGSNPSDSNHRF